MSADVDGLARKAMRDSELELSLEFSRLDRRRALLAEAGIRPPGRFRACPRRTCSAAVGAWTAARYSAGKAEPVPPAHEGRLGAIWR